jgi:hypothetical protein
MKNSWSRVLENYISTLFEYKVKGWEIEKEMIRID